MTKLKSQSGAPVVQSASDVYAPASGEVLEVNSSLVEDPSLVCSDILQSSLMIPYC